MSLTTQNINALSAEIHADNVAAGWWSDPYTGARIDRNMGEMLMLVVTELAEAYVGVSGELMDDKLPHRWMYHVELADAAIRILDIAGSRGMDLAGAWSDELELPDQDSYNAEDLMRVVVLLSEAMEGVRKQDETRIRVNLTAALQTINTIAGLCCFDLLEVIEQKRAFNRTRADHKVENRIAVGGKMC
jgi:hypothetical protein